MITVKIAYMYAILRALKVVGGTASKKDRVLSYLPLIYGRKELL